MQNLAIFFFMAAMANLPWLSNRHYLGLAAPSSTTWVWALNKLLEWLGLYAVFIWTALVFEKNQTGSQYPQDWEFYVVMLLLFSVLSAPLIMGRFVAKQFKARTRRTGM